jgi:hypothetical protein
MIQLQWSIADTLYVHRRFKPAPIFEQRESLSFNSSAKSLALWDMEIETSLLVIFGN